MQAAFLWTAVIFHVVWVRGFSRCHLRLLTVFVLFGKGSLKVLQVHTIVFSFRKITPKAEKERMCYSATGQSDIIRAPHKTA